MLGAKTRRATIAGLALCLVLILGRTAWMERAESKAQMQLTESKKWLRGITVVIDPGHGGNDPGAVVTGTREKELVLEISKRLMQVLEDQGSHVILTRLRDESLGGPIREELSRRVALSKEHRAQVFVSIHANKDNCRCWGAQTFYQRGGMPAGKILAMSIQNRLREWTPTTRVALSADYFVLRTSPVPAAMVEVGFLSDAKEQQRLKDPQYQQTLAAAISLGIADFLRLDVPKAKAQGSIGR